MSDDTEKFKQRVDELWRSAIEYSNGIYEKAEYEYSESIDNELQKLKPSQYEEFMSIAKEGGEYIPDEDRVFWTLHLSKDELDEIGLGDE